MSLNVNNNVGYTVVDGGSISVENGIVSGFSTDDYLDLSQKIDITQNVHIHIDVLSFAATGASQYIFGLANGGGASGGLYFGSTAVGMTFSYGNSCWTNIATGLTVGAPLTVDVVSDGIDFSITVNQGTYTKTSAKTLADLGITGSYTLRLGKLFQAFTSGAINLNKTYVKINGITWFNGKEQASTTVNEVYLNRNVGYTAVDGGSLHIENGIVSGFSLNDYFKVNGLNWSSSIKLEFVCRFKVDTSLITFTNNYTNICYWPFATYFYIGSSTSPTTIVPSSDFTGVSGGISYGKIPTNQYYWIKLETDGNGNATTYSSEDGATWTQKDTKDISSTTTGVYSPAFGIRNNTGGFPGSIDLNNTYIKINGITWFSGKQQASTTVNEVYLNRNVGYTAVDGGSLHIENGIVSGFSADDYLRLVSVPNLSNDFEIGITFTLNNTSNCTIIGNDNFYYQGIVLFSNNAPSFTLNGTNYSVSVSLPKNTVQLGHTYHIVVKREGNSLSISAFENNQMIASNQASIGADFLYRTIYTYQIGKGPDGVFNGSIDLNNTYIKVNGVTWFNGKDVNFSNQNNYIINNGNLVWANPNLWLQGDGASYIDTGIIGNGETTTFEFAYLSPTDNQALFGARQTASSRNLGLVCINGGGRFDYQNTNQFSDILFPVNAKNIIKSKIGSENYTVERYNSDGVLQVTKSISLQSFTTPYTMDLFARNNNGTVDSYSTAAKIYYFKIYTNGVLTKHFVPVPKGLVIGNYTVPSNGMWDIVTQTFFANQGTGSFNFGKEGTTPVWTRSV